MASAESTWRLDRYARYITTKTCLSSSEWKYYEDSRDCPIVMTLTDTDYLVICQGSTVMESHSLVTARAWMRGLSKTDSLLFMYKVKSGTRRFRVKFRSTGSQTADGVCAEAARRLSKFFPVKMTEPAVREHSAHMVLCMIHRWMYHYVQRSDQQGGGTNTDHKCLSGEITLGQSAQILLGESDDRLSRVYNKNCPEANSETISSSLRVFLADPAFPALVELVDTQIRNIMQECQK